MTKRPTRLEDEFERERLNKAVIRAAMRVTEPWRKCVPPVEPGKGTVGALVRACARLAKSRRKS